MTYTDSHSYGHFIDIDLTLDSGIRQSRFRFYHPFYISYSQHPTQLMRMFRFHLYSYTGLPFTFTWNIETFELTKIILLVQIMSPFA